jgi:hypothetical protein
MPRKDRDVQENHYQYADQQGYIFPMLNINSVSIDDEIEIICVCLHGVAQQLLEALPFARMPLDVSPV